MNINSLHLTDTNNDVIFYRISKEHISWDVEFSEKIAENVIKLERTQLYIDEVGNGHDFPMGAATLFTNNLHHSSNITNSGKTLFDYIAEKIKESPGFGKWASLFMLSTHAGFAANDRHLIRFLEQLNAGETVALMSILYCVSKRDCTNISYIDQPSIDSLIEKAINAANGFSGKIIEFIPCSPTYIYYANQKDYIITALKSDKIATDIIKIGAKTLSDLPGSLLELLELFAAQLEAERESPIHAIDKELLNALSSAVNDVKMSTTRIEPKFKGSKSSWDYNLQNLSNIVKHYKSDKELIKKFIDDTKYTKCSFAVNSIEHRCLTDIIQILKDNGFAASAESDIYNCYHLFDKDFELSIEGIEKYIKYWEDEIIGASTAAIISHLFYVSFYCEILKKGLEARINKWKPIIDKLKNEYYCNLYSYASLRCAIPAYRYLIDSDCSHIKTFNHEKYKKESIHDFMIRSGINDSFAIEGDYLVNAFNHLPDEIKSIENKLLCGISLDKKDLAKATRQQIRQSLSIDIDL